MEEKMKTLYAITVLLSLVAAPTIAYGANDCLTDIYKGVESGKKFHPLWPFISGLDTVGTVVIAKNPKKPEAYFGSIDSPDYRPIGATSFAVKQVAFTTPTSCSSARDIGVDVAYSQLDALSKNLSQGAKAQSLTATQSQVNSATPQTAQSGTSSNNSSSASGPSTGSASGSSGSNISDPTATVSKDAYRQSTGADFSSIKSATLKITGLAVQYYDLPVLTQMNSGAALSPTGSALFAQEHGWIISRSLTAATVEYTLTSDSDIHASFLANLVSWLPGMKFKYASARSITLTTTSPVTIGYKLWAPGTAFGGAAVGACSQHGCEIGAEEIDEKVLSQP
jgi:hypothetical protein